MNFIHSLENLKDLLGIKDSQKLDAQKQENLYAIAYGKYELGDYQTAISLFEKLIFYDPYDSRIWKGLAASQQMAKEYEGALRAWAVFSLLTNHEPVGHYHAAECYLSLENLEEAKKALSCATHKLKPHDPLKVKMEKLKTLLEL